MLHKTLPLISPPHLPSAFLPPVHPEMAVPRFLSTVPDNHGCARPNRTAAPVTTTADSLQKYCFVFRHSLPPRSRRSCPVPSLPRFASMRRAMSRPRFRPPGFLRRDCHHLHFPRPVFRHLAVSDFPVNSVIPAASGCSAAPVSVFRKIHNLPLFPSPPLFHLSDRVPRSVHPFRKYVSPPSGFCRKPHLGPPFGAEAATGATGPLRPDAAAYSRSSPDPKAPLQFRKENVRHHRECISRDIAPKPPTRCNRPVPPCKRDSFLYCFLRGYFALKCRPAGVPPRRKH